MFERDSKDLGLIVVVVRDRDDAPRVELPKTSSTENRK